ncbi:MAG: hypothetical protein U0R71_09785 [Solirubrobacterales bacterium]
MVWERIRQLPALAVAVAALLVALGGSVYAAARIDGHTVRVKSLPGNRLVPRSLPADRLRPGAIPGDRLAPGSVTGRQVDAATLGEVPEATHAREADSARRAESALVAGFAEEARRLDGRSAACAEAAREFAGACWEASFSAEAVTAPVAAARCAARGGELPAALTLLAFAGEPGVALAAGGEWTGDITTMAGEDGYAMGVVLPTAAVTSASWSESRRFRCVTPLVS